MNNIYIMCPACSYTGGPTLAHQLCHILRLNGLNARMWYTCNPIKRLYVNPVHERYSHFNNPYTLDAPKDEENNTIVAIETQTGILRKYSKAKKYIWWMSVDNYFLVMGSFVDEIKKHFGKYHPKLEDCMKLETNKSKELITQQDITHLVQSEYARLFLRNRGVSSDQIINLGDYLEDDILSVQYDAQRERGEKTVLYNPKKGFEFTQKLISAAPQLKWIPLINMSKSQVRDALIDSRLYIDFGNHPGKDRFPREAVMCGCCIITGRRGAADNSVDIPIKEKFKFDERKCSVSEVVNAILNLLENYDTIQTEFNLYRESIKNEKNEFEKQALQIFNK